MITAIGYLASGFLALSLLAKEQKKFRYYNILGCIAFIIYGSYIQAFPVILSNTILLVINIIQLKKLNDIG